MQKLKTDVSIFRSVHKTRGFFLTLQTETSKLINVNANVGAHFALALMKNGFG
jgi:hypothetical protein